MKLKLKTSSLSRTPTTKQISLLKLQNSSFCCHNRAAVGLLIFSLSIIILLTQQAVAALAIPPLSLSTSSLSSLSSASPWPASSSLKMISPQVNKNAAAASVTSVFVPAKTTATNVLTAGQRVINSVPVEDRGLFIMYQLAVGLKATGFAQRQPMVLSSLQDLIENIKETTPEFKNVPVYGNFATDLLKWLMEKFNLTHQDVYNYLRTRSQLLCTSDGVCYTSADVGSYCCPF